ncbi:MAG: metal-sensing transcriptional repressor [Epulopiscium sp.]|nr:metal-sensing transcriptional repressor [Candidatus Epulonipiscium sp.]
MKKNSEDKTKGITNRLSRIIGQIQGVKRMIEEGKGCSDVLTQISAARAALDSTAKMILQEHIDSCIKSAIENNDKNAIEDLNSILGKFIR